MVDEGLRAFNVERMYGGEMKVSDLVDAANTLPMMVPRRVVIVLEAEKLFIPKRESKAAEEELQRLEEFLKAPSRSRDDRVRLRGPGHAPARGEAAHEPGAGGQLRCHRERGGRGAMGQGARGARRHHPRSGARRARWWRERVSTSCGCAPGWSA